MLAGAAGALKARSMGGAVAIGVLTHFALDAVPHTDYRMRSLGGFALSLDLVVGCRAVCRLSRRRPIALAGALGGVLPDIIRLTERRYRIPLTGWLHDTIHTPARPSPWRSAAIQGLTVAGSALVLWAAGGDPDRESPPAVP